MTRKQKKSLRRIILSAALYVLLLIIGAKDRGWLGLALFLIPYAVIGWDVLWRAVRNIRNGQVFDENFLMAVATVGAFGCGEYSEAVAVMLFYQVGELFQSVAVSRSRKSISDLMDIRPDYANVEREGALVQVDPEEVAVGDTMIYDSSCFTNQGKVVSPYLDNRISCAILLKVLEEMELCPNDLYVVFTVQEEVGLRGAKPAAWAVDPDYAVVVDVTDVDDTPGSEKCGTVRLGKGPAIKIMDSSVICHPDMIQKLESQAKALDMPTQRDIMRAGGTDAGVMHTTRIGVRTGGVSVPCRYIHTPVEMADLQDARDCAKLLCAFVQSKLESL